MSFSAVVSNTGPILHLHEASATNLLPFLGPVHIPHSVEDEVSRLIASWRPPEWLRVIELENSWREQSVAWQRSDLLHRGEADALALALQQKADVFLTDDTSARTFSETLGVQTRGSLGVVLWAAGKRKIEFEEALDRLNALFASTLWVSEAVQKEAVDALQRLFTK